MRHLRRSRALASLLPALLMSGAIMLVMTVVMLEMHAGAARGFTGAWMETWLTSWSFAFPLTYLVAPIAQRFSARIAQRPR